MCITPVQRLGLVLAAASALAVTGGFVAIGVGQYNTLAPHMHLKFVTSQPIRDGRSPEQKEHDISQANSDSWQGRPLTEQEVQDLVDADAARLGPGVDVSKMRIDHWTPSTLTRATFLSTTDAMFNWSPNQPYHLAVFYGVRALTLGIFLWLLYEPMLGALLRWIRYGGSPRNS